MPVLKVRINPNSQIEAGLRRRFLDLLRKSYEEPEVQRYKRKFLDLLKPARHAQLEQYATEVEKLLITRNIFSCFKVGVSPYCRFHPCQYAFIPLMGDRTDSKHLVSEIKDLKESLVCSPPCDRLLSWLTENFSGAVWDEFVAELRPYLIHGIIVFVELMQADKPLVELLLEDLTRPIVNARQFRLFASSYNLAHFCRESGFCKEQWTIAFDLVVLSMPQETFEDFSKVAEYENALKSILRDRYDVNKNFIVNLALALENKLESKRLYIIEDFLKDPNGDKAKQDLSYFSLREAMAEIKPAENQIFF